MSTVRRFRKFRPYHPKQHRPVFNDLTGVALPRRTTLNAPQHGPSDDDESTESTKLTASPPGTGVRDLQRREAERRAATTEDQVSRALRRSTDIALRKELRAAGPHSHLARQFEEKLLELGLGTLTNLYRNGSLSWTVKGQTFFASQQRMPSTADDRRTLFYFAARESVTKFMNTCIFGDAWNPDGGASLETFFVGKCLICFSVEYRRWYRSQTPEEPVADIEEVIPTQRSADKSSSFDHISVVEDRDEIDQILRKAGATIRERHVYVRHVGQQWTLKEIAHELSASPNSIHRSLTSVRKKIDSAVRGR